MQLSKNVSSKKTWGWGTKSETSKSCSVTNPLYLNVNLSKHRADVIPASQSWISFKRTLIIMGKKGLYF